jgi:hypothetical protein
MQEILFFRGRQQYRIISTPSVRMKIFTFRIDFHAALRHQQMIKILIFGTVKNGCKQNTRAFCGCSAYITISIIPFIHSGFSSIPSLLQRFFWTLLNSGTILFITFIISRGFLPHSQLSRKDSCQASSLLHSPLYFAQSPNVFG